MTTGADIAIALKDISKKYRLFGSPAQRLLETFHPFGRRYHREFWALRDITLDIPRGATVGIVGKNGSGKSTLLQIICSVLRPTSGACEVRGRISALLELGAGFNPELTGRQNVLFNGIVMGFSKEEMQARLPCIESFAEIGEFMDQPMKTYSSGMFVRLAFAAAINVDPEILIVDEALAVGDARFQHKCYAKFQEFQKAGKTILLVSHNTDAIVRHCDHAVLLDGGRVLERGEPKEVTNFYLDLLFSGDLHDYSPMPVLLEDGYKGYDIVHYGKKYYAFSKALGAVDVGTLSKDAIAARVAQETCLAGSSLREVKSIVDGRNPAATAGATPAAVTVPGTPKERAEVESFLQEAPDGDNCVCRKSYNKNEYRYGDKRAEIIDYLIVAGGERDPAHIVSGDTAEIYVKVRYHQPIREPMTGFAIKTIDGIDVFGMNTKNVPVTLDPIDRPAAVAIFRWTVTLNLRGGDYFIDIGCGEWVNGEAKPLDRRYGLVHMLVQCDDAHDGLVRLKTGFERVR